MTPTLRARIAAHVSWANTDDRAARTAAARNAAADRFVRLARERYGDLPSAELERRAEHLKKAHYTRMAAASAEARRSRAEQPRPGDQHPTGPRTEQPPKPPPPRMEAAA